MNDRLVAGKSAAEKEILLVEDNPDDAELTRIAFAEAGGEYDLRVVADGAAAVAYLQRCTPAELPALVLLDLNLPDMSGTDILARIKNSDGPVRRTPVVVLTTTDDAQEIQRCYDLGANVYITKPVNYENFAQAIRQLGLFLSVIQIPDQADG